MSETLPRSATKTLSPETKLTESSKEPLVQLAVLLDTSGSMEGLIHQAQCQLWNAVNQVAKASRDGQKVQLQIAVYEYGSERIPVKLGSLRQVCGFTGDLDEVSEAIFGLHVAGGEEYCGQVISTAVRDLKWSAAPDVYRAIFIAGNESFLQGKQTFGQVLPDLAAKGIVVNTVFCQSRKYTDDGTWKLAAELSGGSASVINHTHKLPSIKTPMDAELVKLNQEMNETFVWFGKGADKAEANQKRQDTNARKMSSHAFAARMSSKIGHLYQQIDHDLVDAVCHGKLSLTAMNPESMPIKLRKMTAADRSAFLDAEIKQRKSVRRKMADTIAARHDYLRSNLTQNQLSAATFGNALTQVIANQAAAAGFKIDSPVVVNRKL